MYTLSANVDLAFSGTSLGSGAGEPKRQKSSMDLKQRFTEVRLFLCHFHQCCAGDDRGVSVPESTCFGMFPQVFSVNNVNVVIRTRTEHLTDEEKARIKSKSRVVFPFLCYFTAKFIFLCSGERNILESLLGTVEQHISAQGVRYTSIYQDERDFSLLIG